MSNSNPNKSRKIGTLFLSTILASGIAAPALANTPREYRNLDPNGVDLTHGDAIISVLEGSIGSGEGELPLIRDQIAVGDGSIVIGYGAHQWDRIFLQRFPVSGGGITTTINQDNRFENFTTNGTLPTGSTLSGSGQEYQYSTSDGTVITFSDPAGHTYGNSTFCNGSDGQSNCVLPPASIRTPDGKTTNIAYDIWGGCEPPQEIDEPFACYYWTRIASVSNNSGYRIAFTYASQGSGGSPTPPPNNWQKRTGATFHNDNAGGSTVASTSYSYPSSGVVDVTDIAGQVWKVTGNNLNITAVRRPGASSDTTSISYSSNQVTSVTREGVTTGYSRSVSGSTATMTVTNALSQTSTVVSNLTNGRPTSVTDALSRTTSYQYDASNRLTEVSYPEGNKKQFAYDARGNVTSTTLKAKSGSGLSDIVTTASYPSSCSNPVTCNSPEWTKDAKGNQTDYTYDATHGGVLTVTAPAGANGIRPQTRYSYTLSSGIYLLTGTSVCTAAASCTGTAGEVTTTIGYNSNKLPVSITAAAGDTSISSSAAATYDALGNLKTVDGPLSGTGDTTTYRYDAGRRLTGVVGPDPDGGNARKPAAQKFNYNSGGLLSSRETGIVDDAGDTAWSAFSSQEQVALTYDSNARPIKTELKSGGTTYALSQTSFDALGRIECSAQRMNPAVFTSLPSSACTLGTQGSGSGDYGPDRIVKNSYNAAGQPIKVQTAYGTTEQSDEVTTAYTSNGRTDYVVDAENNRTDYSYDGHDRIVKTEFPSQTKGANAANSGDYEQLGLDANGNVTSRRLRDGNTIAFGYDHLNRLTSLTPPSPGYADQAVSYTYDNLGRLLSAAKSPGHATTFTYDALGRKTSESGLASNTNYQYDTAGRKTRMSWSDGFYVDYSYLTTGELLNIREYGATSGLGVLATYGYDNLGRRTSLTRGNGTTTTYGYDSVSRLTTLTHDFAGTGQDVSTTFAYNPSNQIASAARDNDSYAWGGHYNVDRSYGSNGLNQLTSSGSVTLGFDARGNLTSSGTASYEYGLANNMWHVPWITFMHRDALERLSYNANEATLFGYDGGEIVTETAYTGAFQPVPSASVGTIARRFVRGPRPDEILVWYEGSGTSDRRWLASDERGSTVAVANDSGAVTTINRYDEYGIPAPTNTGRFQYTGQAWIPSLGLSDYKARIYSPTLGRFMQTDPIGYGDGMNWMNYGGSDPVNRVDPSGLCTADWDHKYYKNGEGVQKSDRLYFYGFKDCDSSSDGYRGFSGGANGADLSGVGAGASGPLTVTVTESCSKIPAAHDKGVQKAALQSLRSAVQTGYEHGFVVTQRVVRPGGYSVGQVFTSNLRRGILRTEVDDNMPGFWSSLWNGTSSDASLFVHTHQNNPPPSPIKGYDQASADSRGITYAAIDKAGNLSCSRK